jgi:predicted DNA-binding transcriptional regulator AlpA
MDTDVVPRALTVDAFCRAYGIGRSTLYRMIKGDAGPRTMKVGRRTLISVEAADEWRRQLEGVSRRDV